MQKLSRDVEAWLKQFAAAVRARDFQSGKTLFDKDVLAFGTVCARAKGLRELSAKQWLAVWRVTKGFDFRYRSARLLRDGSQAVVMADWSSLGVSKNGAVWKRRGRATLVLRRTRTGWKAVHTHFSLNPTTVK